MFALDNEVAICNAALAQIGHDRHIVSLTDGSTESVRCAEAFPRAVARVLSAYNWSWAIREVELDPEQAPSGGGWTLQDLGDYVSSVVKIVDMRDPQGNIVDYKAGYNTEAGGSTIIPDGVATLRIITLADAVANINNGCVPTPFLEAVVACVASLLYTPMFGYAGGSQPERSVHSELEAEAERAIAKAMTCEIDSRNSVWRASGDIRTPIDVCNKALSLIGSGRMIWSFEEDPSDIANICRHQYHLAVKDVLSSFNWEFALGSFEIPQREGGVSTNFSPRLPDDFLRLTDARDLDGKPVQITRTNDGRVKANRMCTVRYVSKNVDLADMPHNVVEAIVARLASLIASSVLGRGASEAEQSSASDKTQALLEIAETRLNEAKVAEVSEHAYMGAVRNTPLARKTAICNEALSLIGSPILVRDFWEDPSDVAVACRLFYDTAFRDVIGAHNWDFASCEEVVFSVPIDDGWSRITLPDDCIRLVGVKNSDGMTLKTNRSRGRVMVKNVSDDARLFVRYISIDVTEDELPPDVARAIAYRLAALLAGSVAKTQGGSAVDLERLDMLYRSQLSAAVVRESNETTEVGAQINPLEEARR